MTTIIIFPPQTSDEMLCIEETLELQEMSPAQVSMMALKILS